MHCVLIGNTGSGKTTLAKALAAKHEIPLVSSGKIARDMSKADAATDLALKQGALAPENSMRAAIKAEIEAAEIRRGAWILDGFPRTVEQLILLMQWTPTLPLFIYLDIPAWTCIERLSARARVDDNPDSIARKFESFQAKTLPMIQILESGGAVHPIGPHVSLEQQLATVETWMS